MALSANTVWEIRTAGDDANGGGFVTGAAGNDYSQQDTKNTVGSDISTTDAVANGTTTITSATANFGTTIVGNIICLQGGTGSLTKVWRQVTARASTTSITVDATVATGTGITMNIGGALASLGMCGASVVGSNIIYIKSGSYTISSATANIASGCFNKNASAISILGYQTTRSDWSTGGTAPVLTASGISSFVLIAVGASGSLVANIALNCASLTSGRGFTLSGGNIFKCSCINATNNAFNSTGQVIAVRCYATGCSSLSFTNLAAFECVAINNSGAGFSTNSPTLVRCIAANNSGGSTDGFITGTANGVFINCVAYNNGRDGFRISAGNFNIQNCIAEANAGIGFNCSTLNGTFTNNAVFNNGTNFSVTGNTTPNLNSVTGASTFFTNAAGGDFSLNNTASAGAAARAAGSPGAFLTLGTTGYLDIGAAQHQESAASTAFSAAYV